MKVGGGFYLLPIVHQALLVTNNICKFIAVVLSIGTNA
jgi:hypothetical protein